MNTLMNRHHAWPNYLGGAVQGLLTNVPGGVHSQFHSLLMDRLERAFGNNYNRNIYQWTSQKEWNELLQRPENRLQVFKILAETSFDIDYIYGTNVMNTLYEQIGKQMAKQYVECYE